MVLSDSDSSDDEDLNFDPFGGGTKRSQRFQDKRVAKGFTILSQAMERADQMKESDDRIAHLKQECATAEQANGTTGDDDFMASIEQSIAEGKAPPETHEANERAQAMAGAVEDLEGVLGPERALELGRARDTELSSVLGARRTVCFDPKRRSTSRTAADSVCSYFDSPQHGNNNNLRNNNKKVPTATAKYATTADYIKQLKEMLRKLVSSDKKLLQTIWIQPLRKESKDPASLKYFLEQRHLAKLRHEYDMADIPAEILLWLLQVACSVDISIDEDDDEDARVQGVEIRDGAMETLQALLRSNKVFMDKNNLDSNKNNRSDSDNHNDREEEEEEAAATSITRPAFLCLSQMAVQLLSWVPLATTEATMAAAAQQDANPQSSEHDSKSASSSNSNNDRVANARGLERLLSIWYTAFESDQVSAPKGEAGWQDATRCIMLLVKAGIDGRLHSTDIHFRIEKHLKCVISKLLEFVKRQVFCDGEIQFLDWTKVAAKAVIGELANSDLGPGDKEAEDSGDDKAWGCYARACWVLPMMARTHGLKTDCQFQMSSLQFKAALCLQALEHFFIPSSSDNETGKAFQSWQEEVYVIVSNCQRKDKAKYDLVEKAKHSLPWFVLCSSLAALVKLNDLGGSVQAHECKCLATVQIALGRCLEVGMEFFKDDDDDVKSNNKEESDEGTTSGRKNEYKTAEEARDVARLLGLVQFQCTVLASRMGSSLMNSYFTRAGYLVQCHNKYFHEAQERAAHLGGDRAVVQASLDSWLKKDKNAGSNGVPNADDEEMKAADDGDDEVEASPPKKLRLSQENVVFSEAMQLLATT